MIKVYLQSAAPNAHGQLKIFGHNRHPFLIYMRETMVVEKRPLAYTECRQKNNIPRDTYRMNTTKIGVMKNANEMSFRRLLEREQCLRLDPQFLSHLLSDTNQDLRGNSGKSCSWDNVICRFLIPPDFAKCDSPRTIPFWLIRRLLSFASGSGA
jgi:hypothetical protein